MNPDKLKQVVSDAQWHMQLGNSMSVNVVERLLSRLLPAVGLTQRRRAERARSHQGFGPTVTSFVSGCRVRCRLLA